MNIRVTPGVLSETRWHPLLDLIAELAQNVELRLSFDARDAQQLLQSSWLSAATGARRTIADILKASIKATSRAMPSDATTLLLDETAAKSGVSEAAGIIRVHPLGGLTIMTQPFHLIVEDEHSDGGFLLWMARLTGRDEVIRAYRAGRLVFRHAGGKGQLAKSATALSAGVWPRPGNEIIALRYRCGAMLDSDARFPGDSPNAAIVETLTDRVAFTHMLRARTIENYVPRKYFRRRMAEDGLESRADAFFQLTDEQRAHFPIKKGFVANTPPNEPLSLAEFTADGGRAADERNHFGAIAGNLWDQVALGFGERLSSVYVDTGYRCNPGEGGDLTAGERAEIDSLLGLLVRHL